VILPNLPTEDFFTIIEWYAFRASQLALFLYGLYRILRREIGREKMQTNEERRDKHDQRGGSFAGSNGL
jgi:hypothetical protein